MEAGPPLVDGLMNTGDEEFYRKHADGLIRLATVLVGPSDAEDVFGGAVLKVLNTRRWPNLDDDEKRGYLYRSVVNEARTWVRRAGNRRARERLAASREAVDGGSVERPEVWEAVCGLSVRQRAVVFLTYWEDLDTATVAERLGISVGSVYQHLNRARTTLKGVIDD